MVETFLGHYRNPAVLAFSQIEIYLEKKNTKIRVVYRL